MRINQIIQSGMVDICIIQETKLQKIDSKLVCSLWRNNDGEWTSFASHGFSRGIPIMWIVGSLYLIYNFRGYGFVGMNVNWNELACYIVNIYSY